MIEGKLKVGHLLRLNQTNLGLKGHLQRSDIYDDSNRLNQTNLGLKVIKSDKEAWVRCGCLNQTNLGLKVSVISMSALKSM